MYILQLLANTLQVSAPTLVIEEPFYRNCIRLECRAKENETASGEARVWRMCLTGAIIEMTLERRRGQMPQTVSFE